MMFMHEAVIFLAYVLQYTYQVVTYTFDKQYNNLYHGSLYLKPDITFVTLKILHLNSANTHNTHPYIYIYYYVLYAVLKVIPVQQSIQGDAVQVLSGV